MAIYYIDFEGSAGTGNGTSFANRANNFNALAGLSPNDEIRIKKTADPTSLGTGKVKYAKCQPYYNYLSNSNAWNLSTTEGDTYVATSNSQWKGWEEDDVIHFGQDATNPAGKNFNGLYRVGVTDSWNQTGSGKVELKGFTASANETSTTNRRYWAMSSNSVILNTTGLTKSIACRDAARSAFTAAAGVTTASCVFTSGDWNQPVDWILGTGSDKFELPSSISAGKAAHFQLPSALDLSGYQQISFMVRNYSGRSATAHDSIRLCTDTNGDTSVHTIPINTRYASTSYWIPVVVDLGTNLNSSIQSIAIYRDTTGTTRNYYISNIIACKASSAADSITHKSLIGLNTTADPVWYSIQNIWDEIIELRTSYGEQGNYGYYGHASGWFSADNNNATIYKREPYEIAGVNSDASNPPSYDSQNIFSANFGNGTAGNEIIMSGGWDDTSMSSKNGKTFLRGTGEGRFMTINSNYVLIDNIYLNAFARGIDIENNVGMGFTNCGFTDFKRQSISAQYATEISKLSLDYVHGFREQGLHLNQSAQKANATATDFKITWYTGQAQTNGLQLYQLASEWVWDLIRAEGTSNAIVIQSLTHPITFNTLYLGNHFSSYTVNCSTGASFGNVYQTDPGSMGFYSTSGSRITINNFQSLATFNDPTQANTGKRYGRSIPRNGCMQISNNSETTILDGRIDTKFYNYGGVVKAKSLQMPPDIDNYYTGDNGGQLLMKDYDNNAGQYKNVFYNGEINPETSVRHTASGFSVKFVFTNASNTTLSFIPGKIICAASSQVTIGVWTYRTATDKVNKLIIPKNTDLGINSDVEADNSSSSVNTWTKIELTFTPSTAGPVSIKLQVNSTSSTSSYAYFDDLEVAQA